MAKPRKTHKRTITDADRRAATRLRALWDATPKERRGTQADAAAAWGDHANQSLISQYLRGDLALNYAALLFFSGYLGCSPEQIRDDLPEQQLAARYAAPSGAAVGLHFRAPDSVAKQPLHDLDASALRAALEAVEQALASARIRLPVAARAELIAVAYRAILSSGMDHAASEVTQALRAISEGAERGDRKRSPRPVD